MNNNLDEIKNNLTLDQVFSLLAALGAEPQQKEDYIMSRTICHGGNSHKLYYYDNTKLFRCFTECSESFDIFQLVIKIHQLDGDKNYSLNQAYYYIVNFFGISIENKNFENNEEVLEDWKILNNYNKILDNYNNKKVEFKNFDDKILEYLPHPRILPWEQENITQEVMKRHKICYNPSTAAIVIPHFNQDNVLIGIRERTLIKDNEIYGKYRPMYLNHIMYNHPLGFNLYNLNFSKNNINLIKKAIIFEGEKSCLLYASYFGEENDISVAVCGSALSSFQVKLLLDLEVEEIIIAFDKQFKELGDKEHTGWVKKLKDINKKYSQYVKVSYMFDKENLLDYKDSPIDKGPETFMTLFDKRISL